MSKKKRTESSENKNYDCIKSFPLWYWTRGLHDSKVLSIHTEELLADYNLKDYKYNKMEFCLDWEASLGENVSKIILYNYKVVTGRLPNTNEHEAWWIGDRLSKTAEGKYLLELELATDENDKRYISRIEFQAAEAYRT